MTRGKVQPLAQPLDVGDGAAQARQLLATIVGAMLGDAGVPERIVMSAVRAAWPEVARATLVAAGPLIDARPPSDATSRLTASAKADGALVEPVLTFEVGSTYGVIIDCAEAMDRLIAVVGEIDAVRLMSELDVDYGWSYPRLPHRGRVADMVEWTCPFAGDLYWNRVREFVRAANTRAVIGAAGSRRIARLLSYLLRPAPIDGWKPHVGTHQYRPRLWHLIAALGDEIIPLGERRLPETLKAAVASPRLKARITRLADRAEAAIRDAKSDPSAISAPSSDHFAGVDGAKRNDASWHPATLAPSLSP